MEEETTNPAEGVGTERQEAEAIAHDGDQAEADAGEATEAAAAEPVEVDAEGDDLDGIDDEILDEGPKADEPDDLVDFELEDGRTVKVPTAVKEGLMRQADYTRKTQELAEQRKAAEQAMQQIEQQRKDWEQYQKEHSDLYAVESLISDYEKVDWGKLLQENEKDYLVHKHQYDQLVRRQSELARSLDTKRQEYRQTQQQEQLEKQREYARRIEQGKERLKREIPNWNAELETKLVARAAEQQIEGITPEVLAAYPGVARELYKASRWDELQKRRMKQKEEKAKPKPTRTVGQSNRIDDGSPRKGLPHKEMVNRLIDEKLKSMY